MKLVFPSVEIVSAMPYESALKLVEQAGRTCTQTVERLSSSDVESEKFVKDRLDQGHYSIAEHVNLTCRFITNRKAMAEFTRHRLSSYSVESTRFCNYSKDRFPGLTFLFPVWRWGECPEVVEGQYIANGMKVGYKDLFEMNIQSIEDTPHLVSHRDLNQFVIWMQSNLENELSYFRCLAAGCGVDTASELLNSALKVEMLVTKNVRMWIDFFLKRIGKRVYPGADYLAKKLSRRLEAEYPVFFNRKVFLAGV